MVKILWIALGGALGAVSRYGMTQLISQRIHTIFPWGTYGVNIIGSFLLGFLFELGQRLTLPNNLRIMLTIGFLGAFTTFSTFSLETVNLLREKELTWAGLNILLSIVTGIIACFVGIFCLRVLLKMIMK